MNWRSAIARNRNNRLLRALAWGCAKYLRAYDNQFNWDIESNGERFIAASVLAVAPGVVFDVGANVGNYARMCAAIPGAISVHAFEISPPTVLHLQHNCGGMERIRLNAFGLGAQAGHVTIHHAPESADRTGVLAIDDGYARETLTAELQTGDDYMAREGIDRVAFLKIDVEGMDLDTLRGFAGAFAGGRVAAVQFEHGEPNVESRTFLRDIVGFLWGHGFVCFRLYPSSLERIDRHDYALEDFRGRNYVALLPDLAKMLHV